MEQISFLDISIQCNSILRQVLNETIQKIYGCFNFFYFPNLKSNAQNTNNVIIEQNTVETILTEFLKNYKFITYHTLNNEEYDFSIPIEQHSDIKIKYDYKPNLISAIICVEKKCIIIKAIDESLFSKIIENILQLNISVIKYRNNYYDYKASQEQDEVNAVYNFLKDSIDECKFVECTFSSIVGYLIRRNFYPKNYFIDQLFFEYDQSENSNYEDKLKNKINDLLNIGNNKKLEYNIKMLKEIKESLKPDYHYKEKNDFHTNEFIILRKIHENEVAKFSLVLHLKNLNIFMMKELNQPIELNNNKQENNDDDAKVEIKQEEEEKNESENKNEENNKSNEENETIEEPVDEIRNRVIHEIDFCKKFSHRSFVPFYGFIKEENLIYGFIYKYMCNNDLYYTLTSNKNNFDEKFSLTAMFRIINGIKYLQENYLIHRDIKPDNILLDNDFVPYISDFETIRHLKKDDIKKNVNENICIQFNYDDKKYTDNIGSNLYMAPEQLRGEYYLYATDIYALGLLIYFIFEKEDMFDDISCSNIKMVNASQNIQNIYKNCVQEIPKDRIKIDQIFQYIRQEINSICIPQLSSKFSQNQIVDIICEYIFIDSNEKNKLLIDNIFCSRLELFARSDDEKSNLYLKLGMCFNDGNGLRKNYLKAKYYYELSCRYNNYYAYTYLGKLYYYGNGVVKDYFEASRLFEKAFQHNSYAILYLADIYYNGYFLNKNIPKALELYELSAKKKNSIALYALGNHYENIINHDYAKSREYYELSGKLGNADALFRLGCLYYIGLGVIRNIERSYKYFLLAVKNNSVDAFNVLANLFYIPGGKQYDFESKINFFQNKYNNRVGVVVNKGPMNASSYSSYMNKDKPDNHVVFLNYNEITYKGYTNYAKDGNSNVMIILGDYYFNGMNLKQDYTKSKFFYELAAQKKNPYGYLHLGEMYENGNGVEVDYMRAKKYYEKAAELNNTEALVNIGKLYYNGYGVKQDYFKAKKYFEEAAKYNNYDAYNYLGNIYYYGYGTVKNLEKAKECYEKSIHSKYPDTLLNLGNIYFYGKGAEKDVLIAKQLFEKSEHDHHNPNATLCLGSFYESEKNYIEAKNKYEELIPKDDNLNYDCDTDENDDCPLCFSMNANDSSSLITRKIEAEAYFRLGNLYENGLGVEKDIKKAIKYYEISIKENNTNAMLKLGKILLEGNGTEKDIAKAMYYFQLSSEQGNSCASCVLGNLYENGENVKMDIDKAKSLYELSAEKKNPEAYLHLGKLYFYGKGVEKDYEIARDYFYKASQKDNSEALFYLGEIYFHGYGVEINYIKALGYYELSAKLDNPDATFYLGNFYSNGDIYDIDIKKAIEYYLQCTKINNDKISVTYNPIDSVSDYYIQKNNHIYHAYNNIGLIYLTINIDFKKAFEYIKEAGFAEFAFGQNNLGLIYQYYYLNQNSNAEYFYTKASKSNFSLAYFNLGFIEEKKNKIDKSMEYYINASKYDNEPLIFHNYKYIDERLEISKKFISCLADLKLTNYYLKDSSKQDFTKAKDYFIKAFSRIISNEEKNSYKFNFELHMTNVNFSYLKKFILNYPPFKLNIDENNQNEKNSQKIEINNNMEEFNMKLNENDQNTLSIENLSYIDVGDLFDFVISKNIYREDFINCINDIINTMEVILLKPPYIILFGRISIEKPTQKPKQQVNNDHIKKDLNEDFYEGLMID